MEEDDKRKTLTLAPDTSDNQRKRKDFYENEGSGVLGKLAYTHSEEEGGKRKLQDRKTQPIRNHFDILKLNLGQ